MLRVYIYMYVCNHSSYSQNIFLRTAGAKFKAKLFHNCKPVAVVVVIVHNPELSDHFLLMVRLVVS